MAYAVGSYVDVEEEVRVAVCQLAPVQGDIRANCLTIRQTVMGLRGRADLAIFPELFLTGYDIGTERMHDLAMAADDPAVLAIGALARDAGIAVCVSFPERPDPGKTTTHITATVFDNNGSRVAKYRKNHLWGPYEKATFTPGLGNFTPFKLRDFDTITFGMLICFDVEMTEVSRILAVKGAQILLAPAAVAGDMSDVSMVGRVRSMENHVHLVYTNHARAPPPGAPTVEPATAAGDAAASDVEHTFKPRPAGEPAIPLDDPAVAKRLPMSGGSFIASPQGRPLMKLGLEAEVSVVTLHPFKPEYVEAAARNPYLADRRPELYKALVGNSPKPTPDPSLPTATARAEEEGIARANALLGLGTL